MIVIEKRRKILLAKLIAVMRRPEESGLMMIGALGEVWDTCTVYG
jgi:hypothetical protein